MDLTEYIFIDQHAHPLMKRQLEMDGFAFRQCFTESRASQCITEFVPNSLHYTDLLNQLSMRFDLDGEGSFFGFRAAQEQTDYVRALLDEMSFGASIIDEGFAPAEAMSLNEMAAVTGRPMFSCRRIEKILEDAIVETSTFDDLCTRFATELFSQSGAGNEPIALKTIMGYRGGLQLDIVTAAEAQADYPLVKSEFADTSRRRITRRPLYHYLLLQAFELASKHDLPVQIHTGLGDDDANLIDCNPAILQPMLKMPSLRKTKWVLLHCYPYVREASILAALYPNVYMDLSLSVNLISANSAQLIVEALSCAPSTKLLAGSDGHSCVESWWYGALCWKRGLGLALDRLLDDGFLKISQAEQVAANVLHANALDLYKLEG